MGDPVACDPSDAFVDLHLHSNYSDGADSPEAVVARAKRIGVAAIALTDHDTTAGVAEARTHATAAGIKFLTGVEISTVFDEHEIHVLAYGIAIDDTALQTLLEWNQTARKRRATAILERLEQADVTLSWDEVVSQTADGVPGRMHIARALYERGVVKTVQKAFDQYLNPGRSAFVRKEMAHTSDALDAIHGAGGLGFVAHPALNKSTLRALPALLQYPFDGVEAYHIAHSAGRTQQLIETAADYGLLVSGGSDCHGGIKGEPEIGKVRTPYKHYRAIVEAEAQPR